MSDNKKQKIKVCNNVDEVIKFLNEHKELKVCLYLAYKTPGDWDISTSRIYMNKINDKFAYLPINIEKDDTESIRKIYELSQKSNQIVAINQTQPHKSNTILKEWFANQNLPNVDSLVKDKENRLICYNLNGPAFTGWFEDEVCRFNNKSVVIFGVGGVGEPIARAIATKGCKKIYLVDINSKDNLVKELSEKTDVCYAKKLSNISFEDSEFILINCAGKEGADDEEIRNVIKRFKGLNNIFVVLRPQLDIDIVNMSKKLGWNAFTGFGMNSRNDYALLEKIREIANIDIPTFIEFAELVKSAS